MSTETISRSEPSAAPDDTADIMPFDVVELREDIPGTRYKAGMIGTIIDDLNSGGEAFLLEINDRHGVPLDEAEWTPVVYPHQVRLVARYRTTPEQDNGG